jgi:hypothetical protein
VARRKANFASAIATASEWTDRVTRVQLIESDSRVPVTTPQG